jgi:glycosyltransferase involved in cell wall biosynthesis
MGGEIRSLLSAIAPNVHFLGRVAHDEVPGMLANADLHVTTSGKESLGLTVLEARASDIPVLVPRCGGVCEEVRDAWKNLVDFSDECRVAQAAE